MPKAARILVVEDEAVIADDLQYTLRRLGYDVPTTAATALEAISATTELRPDLVLMDIRLRGDLDGVEAARAIKEHQDTPIVFLTSYSDNETFARVKDVMPHACLHKPYDERALRNAIEIALARVAIERRLAERERWFATTLASIGDGVITTDSNDRITFLNPVAEKITGYDKSEAQGRALSEVLPLIGPDGARLPSPVARAIEPGQSQDLPRGTQLLRRDGARIPVDDSASPILSDDEFTGGVIVFRDVTERRRLEQRVSLSERLAALGALAAGMGHEINNPLTYVLTNLTYCEDALSKLLDPQDPKHRDVLAALRDARVGSDHIRHIVARLRPFSRPDAGQRRPTSIGEIVRLAVRQTSHVLSSVVQVDVVGDSKPLVEVVGSELVQVVTNLLVNAAHAVAEAKRPMSRVSVRYGVEGNGCAFIDVEDNGTGIAPNVVDRIFEPFFTTKSWNQGSGIGLALSQTLATANGGELRVRSTLGEGTTFRLSLPLATAKPKSDGVPAAEIGRETARRHVVLVDDDVGVIRAMERILRDDHRMESFTDPRLALARLVTEPTPDIILCDVMMPGLSGIELYQRLNDAAPHVAERVVFISGGALTPESETFLAQAHVRVLAKPIAVSELRAAVASAR